MNEVMLIITSVLGGGTLSAIITTLVNKRKVDAESKNTNIEGLIEMNREHIKSVMEIDDRINVRLVDMEKRLAHQDEIIAELREDLQKKEEEILVLKAQLEKNR